MNHRGYSRVQRAPGERAARKTKLCVAAPKKSIVEKKVALLINDLRAGNEGKRKEATTLSVTDATNG